METPAYEMVYGECILFHNGKFYYVIAGWDYDHKNTMRYISKYDRSLFKDAMLQQVTISCTIG